ncbi:hypothetical protein [Gillisia sp. Hel_I_29]|uniref:hypothetical protein n=1 Tax=Gillisia sp. Hel_I_29 TaxID=1249975 RepID=UPI000553F8E1|nr:hypothetical protein [Gillisia sp. Hel_I_29]
MSKRRSLFVNCTEATNCCDKAQYDEATFFEKLKIRIHIAICGPCKKYTTKNHKLTELIEKSELKTCTEEQKKQWQEKIDKEISN